MGKIDEIYSVSTSVYGTGSQVNSFKTPLGRHKISEKIGEGLPEGAILKGRSWTGAIANIIKEKKAFPNQILAVTFTNKAANEMLNILKKKVTAF